MTDIVEKLIKIADASKTKVGADIPLGEQCREAASEITRLREQVAAKDKALEVFADALTISNHDDDRDIDDSIAATKITVGDLRRAQSAINDEYEEHWMAREGRIAQYGGREQDNGQ